MLVHRRVTPCINFKFAGTHLYTWVERDAVRVIKCLAQEYNIMSAAKGQTRTACSGVERTNQEHHAYFLVVGDKKCGNVLTSPMNLVYW